MGRKRNVVFEDDEQDGEVIFVKKVKRKVVNLTADDEDNDNDERLDQFENDGFLVDDVEEEEEEDTGEQKQKKKKRKKKSLKSFLLDDDDYELLQENATAFHRPNMGTENFKRLRKAGGHSAVGNHSGFSDEEGPGVEDVDDSEDEKIISDDDDDMADFIVDDEEHYQNRAPVRQRKMKEKKLRRAKVASSPKLGEGYLVGNVDELLELHKQRLATSAKSDDNVEFEPFVLSEKYVAEKDDNIYKIDMPERMQISEATTGPAPIDKVSIEEESSWILRQLTTSQMPLFCEKRVIEGTDEGLNVLKNIDKEDIVKFLKLYHVEKYDIPFIAMYRKEQCLSLLIDGEQEEVENTDRDVSERKHRLKWHKVLWAIKELDTKWLQLQNRKSALQKYYNKRYKEESNNVYDIERLTLIEKLFDSITKSLKMAESERDIDDVDTKFSLHFPPVEVGVGVGVGEGEFKRPKRKSLYDNCIKAGLQKLAEKFGYNSEQFGLNITLEKVRMEVLDDPEESPEEMASSFTSLMFETPEAVLKGARHMVAMEISCEPCFRRHVRSIFMDKALVSTNPTPEGNKSIDSSHQFAGVKWLRNKPLSRFLDAQWLLIQKAEDEKLLQVTINLPESTLNELTSVSTDYYLGDDLNKSGPLWKEQRKLILQEGLVDFLLPAMEKETRALLITRAKDWLLMEYGKQLWNRVSVAPYQHDENNVGENDETGLKVMACCWGPGKPATTFVMLDSSGQLRDVLYAGSVSLRSQNVNDQQRKINDQQRVLKFLRDHQPHVVVLGAMNFSCTRLKEDLEEIITKMAEENPGDFCHAVRRIAIVYGDGSLPTIYENSQISSDQLPGYSDIVKRAVALGRYLQNPLAMVATLCGDGKEIVNWKFSSLEYLLTPDEKYVMVEQVMVDVTNQVGIDMNLAVSHDWRSAPLQFISGLGPKRAASLRTALVGVREVENRKELTDFGLRMKKVFQNAVGFLRVQCSELVATGRDIDLLDDTRIHPESYGLANELAEAVHKYFVQDHMDGEVMSAQVIEYVRNNPQSLIDFNINEYADKYRTEKGENKRETLFDIKVELSHGFQDPRQPYKEPTQDEEFYMISGGKGDTLTEGRIVQARVCRVQPQRAICVLDSGFMGILSHDAFSDQGGDFDLTEKLHQGDMLSCKIRQIEKNRYQVFLTCKESDLKCKQNQNFHDVDPYYCEGWGNSLTLQEKVYKEEELAKKHFNPRRIDHPLFHNMTLNEAIQFLSLKDAGEIIFRPSPRGASYLTLTLKVYDDIYAHKDIIEGGKDDKDITSFLSLGKTLKIGDDVYGDLDEVMERYVGPLVTHLKEMLGYRKFKRGSKMEVDDILRAEKSVYPMRIVYCLSLSHEHPGTFILSYIRSTSPHHEYIGLYPKGFKFRKQTFENIDQLVAYFQQHIDDLQHKSALSARSFSSSLGTSTSNDWGNNDKLSTPSSSGRTDFGDGGRGHPSGVPRPYGERGGGRGRGRGRGRGSYNDRDDNNGNDGNDSSNGGTNWGSNMKDGNGGDNGWSSFSNKVQNSPIKEASSGGWGSSGNWAGAQRNANASGSNWGGSSNGGNWGDAQGGWNSTSANRGGRGERGRGRGRGRGDNNFNERKDSDHGASGWGLDSKDEVGGDKGWSSSGNAQGGWSSGGGNWGGAQGNGNASGGNCDGGQGGWSSTGGSRGGRSGHGRGRGDNNFNERKDSDHGASGWGLDFKDEGEGNKGWSSSGNAQGGWSSGGGNWGDAQGSGTAGGGDRGGCGRSRGRGRGRGRGSFGCRGNSNGNDSNYAASRWSEDSKEVDGGNKGWGGNGNASASGGGNSNAGGWGGNSNTSGGGSDNAGGGNWSGSNGDTGGWGGSRGGGSDRGGRRDGGNRGGRGERGRGRGRGRGRDSDNGNDSNYGASRWGEDSKDVDGGNKGWGGNGNASAGGGNSNTGGWGGKSNTGGGGSDNAGGENRSGSNGDTGGWGGSRGGGSDRGGRRGGGNWGGRGERGRGRGRQRDSYDSGSNSGGWGGSSGGGRGWSSSGGNDGNGSGGWGGSGGGDSATGGRGWSSRSGNNGNEGGGWGGSSGGSGENGGGGWSSGGGNDGNGSGGWGSKSAGGSNDGNGSGGWGSKSSGGGWGDKKTDGDSGGGSSWGSGGGGWEAKKNSGGSSSGW